MVKATEEGEFGHPICLMLSEWGLVKSYKKLEFYLQKNRKKSKCGQCSICTKVSQIDELFKCYEK